jgi:hypothetical protein
MNDLEVTEILLVEDSDADAEMTMRALKKGKVANKSTRPAPSEIDPAGYQDATDGRHRCPETPQIR